jgi:DUF1680 family protein
MPDDFFRGQDPEFFLKENGILELPEFKQVHLPVREQVKAAGHAVRALYMYCGMADVGDACCDESLLDACKTLYNNIVNCQMYVTGGVGSRWWYESFSSDYDLPNNSRSYSESCAGIGLALFANKMACITGESSYIDTLERTIFNIIHAGISLSGDEYFYSNYLEVNDNFIPYMCGSRTRQKWFFCSCCPTNFCRFLTQLPQLIWGEDASGNLYLNIPVANSLDYNDKAIEVTGGYPEDGKIKITVKTNGAFALNLRIPEFAKSIKLALNGELLSVECKNGYAVINREWHAGDVVDYKLDMPFELVRSNSRLTDNTGKVAIARGPVIYCVENTDNIADVRDLCIASNSEFTPKPISGLEAYGTAVECDGFAVEERGKSLYSSAPRVLKPCRITAIPYALWQNRGETNMSVWLPEK